MMPWLIIRWVYKMFNWFRAAVSAAARRYACYQNCQYRALFWQPCLKVGVQEGLNFQYLMILSENACFLRHNLFQKWKFLHLKTKYAFLTFSGSNTDHYPRATVAMETVDQGIKLKLVELFFLKYEHKWPWF